MKHEIDLKKYDIRSDLILECFKDNLKKIDKEEKVYEDVKVTNILIDDKISRVLGKEKGSYVTIEFKDITDSCNNRKVLEIFQSELDKLIIKQNLKEKYKTLIIGLGNIESTADSLGPKTISNVLVTRHLFILGEDVEDNIGNVSALSPGVMAKTGIETFDIVSSIVNQIKPDLVIVVDSLCSSSVTRINKSIQLTDTGINPGSGIGNNRKEISKKTLHIPVIGIGVPTVVSSSTLVYDAINYLFKHISYLKNNPLQNKLVLNRTNYLNKIKDEELDIDDKKNIFGLLGTLDNNKQKMLIEEVLNSVNYNLIVTPKEIDFQIEKMASLLAKGINSCLHKNVK